MLFVVENASEELPQNCSAPAGGFQPTSVLSQRRPCSPNPGVGRLTCQMCIADIT